jgi:hypothetical protein
MGRQIKILMILATLLLIGGCAEIQAMQQTRRDAVVARFKEAYPNNWQQKLLEYDIEQERQRQKYLANQKTLIELEAEYAEKGRKDQENFEQDQRNQKLDQFLQEQEQKKYYPNK